MKVVGYKDYNIDSENILSNQLYFKKGWFGSRSYVIVTSDSSYQMELELQDWLLMGLLPKDVIFVNKRHQQYTTEAGPY